MALSKVFALLTLSIIVGCGPGQTAVEVPQTGVKDLIKQQLQSPANSGTLGSEMMAIEQDLQKLSAEDPAKATELQKDMEELKKATNPTAVKAKAKAMIDKL